MIKKGTGVFLEFIKLCLEQAHNTNRQSFAFSWLATSLQNDISNNSEYKLC